MTFSLSDALTPLTIKTLLSFFDLYRSFKLFNSPTTSTSYCCPTASVSSYPHSPFAACCSQSAICYSLGLISCIFQCLYSACSEDWSFLSLIQPTTSLTWFEYGCFQKMNWSSKVKIAFWLETELYSICVVEEQAFHGESWLSNSYYLAWYFQWLWIHFASILVLLAHPCCY